MATHKFLVFKLDDNAVACLGEIAVDALQPHAGNIFAFALRDAIAAKDSSITDVLAVRIFAFDSTTQRKKGRAIEHSALLSTGTTYCYEFNKRKVADAEGAPEKKRERLEHQVVETPHSRNGRCKECGHTIDQHEHCQQSPSHTSLPPDACGRTQQELDKLLDKHYDTQRMDMYFFNASEKVADIPRHLQKKWGNIVEVLCDGLVRCKECGHTIDEHMSETTATAITSLLKESGSWPTVLAPPTTSTVNGLAFVETKDGNWCFGPGEKRMVRIEYIKLWERFLNVCNNIDHTHKAMLIRGHPGIGKTFLLDLLLTWCLHEKLFDGILCVTTTTLVVLSTSTGKRYEKCRVTDSFATIVEELCRAGITRSSKLLVLHDIKTNIVLPYQGALVSVLCKNFHVTCVVAPSEENNIKNFEKESYFLQCRSRYFLPTLTCGESYAFMTQMGLDHQDERFDVCGGVPGHLMSNHNAILNDQKLAACTVKFEPGTLHNTKDSDKIVCPVPDKERDSVHVFDFVSASARRIWLGQNEDTAWKALQRLRDAQCDEQTGDVLGRVFEDFVMESIVNSKQNKFCRASIAKEPGKLELWELPDEMTVARFHGDSFEKLTKVSHTTLFVPYLPKFPVISAALVSAEGKATLIQVAVGNNHPPKAEKTQALLNHLKNQNIIVESFVWIVYSSSNIMSRTSPPSLDGVGTIKEDKNHQQYYQTNEEYKALNHYLCRLDEHMCWVKKSNTTNPAVAFPMRSRVQVSEAKILEEIRACVDADATSLQNFNKEIGSLEEPLLYRID